MSAEAQHKISAMAQVEKISGENSVDTPLFPLAGPFQTTKLELPLFVSSHPYPKPGCQVSSSPTSPAIAQVNMSSGDNYFCPVPSFGNPFPIPVQMEV